MVCFVNRKMAVRRALRECMDGCLHLAFGVHTERAMPLASTCRDACTLRMCAQNTHIAGSSEAPHTRARSTWWRSITLGVMCARREERTPWLSLEKLHAVRRLCSLPCACSLTGRRTGA